MSTLIGTRFISSDDLPRLVADCRASGTTVIGPARTAGHSDVEYRLLDDPAQLCLNELPARSLKEFFLPPTEQLLRWRQEGGDVSIEESATSFTPRVIIGARPCDCAAVEILERVMGWDYRDELWFGRREATTIIGLACSAGDSACFCSTLSCAPDSARGADLLLIPLEGGYHVEIVTSKGEALIKAHAARFTGEGRDSMAEAFRKAVHQRQTPRADLAQLKAWLGAHFDHELWQQLALRCHGCGACAAVCPTCHCFDIVDEPAGYGGGARRRNWDTCQTAKFTVHASGHNPRADQSARYRQRILHKLFIYPSRFGEVLCTGCGRCVRSCPGGMDLPEVIAEIGRLAEGAR